MKKHGGFIVIASNIFIVFPLFFLLSIALFVPKHSSVSTRTMLRKYQNIAP